MQFNLTHEFFCARVFNFLTAVKLVKIGVQEWDLNTAIGRSLAYAQSYVLDASMV